MSRKVQALKKFAVALGYGESVSEYEGQTFAHVLKELAVKMQCAESTDAIRTNSVAGVLEYIAKNKGQEEVEPFDLIETPTHATITVKRKNKVVEAGPDILYNGDVLKITAEADEGYELTTLTLNGETIESGDSFTVNGHHVTIVATAEAEQVEEG